ncbi:MAG TPA: hypothetical protein VF618_24450 [Thermoanaerobaculia bacterium]
MNRAAVAALWCSLAFARVGPAQNCTAQLYPANNGGSIGIMCSSACPPGAAIDAAIWEWATCNASTSDIAEFRNNAAGSAFDIQIVLHSGNSAAASGGCGQFLAGRDPSTGRVTGGTVEIWTNRSDGSSCSPYDKTIAHELGHVLGLNDAVSGCSNHIMAGRPSSGADPRSVQPDECSAVDANWTTPGETSQTGTGTGSGGPRNNDCSTAPESCSPLVLDLEGDGIGTSGVADPVLFDIDADGHLELMNWLARGDDDAFLWIDINRNHRVDDGSELLGVGTLLPEGRRATDGFEALSAYDRIENGGNEDGLISSADAVWRRLQLWFDVDHDARSTPAEVRPIEISAAIALELTYVVDRTPDAHGNLHLLRGSFLKREPGNRVVRFALEDIFFTAP